MASFISERELTKSRNFKKREQDEVLSAAKKDYEERERYKQYQKESGQDKWMLPSLQDRLDRETQKHHSNDKVKKEKKKKSKKKHKKRDSDSESEEDMWVEAQTDPVEVIKAPVETTKVDTNDWMQQDFLSGIKTVSSQDVREERKVKKQDKLTTKQLSTLDLLGQHEKELNPYWKSGGSGLPSVEQAKPSKTPCASWLRRSLHRMEEESNSTGRDLKSIAAERYGSWDAFHTMLKEAEAKESKSSNSTQPRQSKSRFRKPDDDGDDYRSHSKRHDREPRKRFLKPGENERRDGDSSSVRSKRKAEEQGWRKSSSHSSKKDHRVERTDKLSRSAKPENDTTSDNGVNQAKIKIVAVEEKQPETKAVMPKDTNITAVTPKQQSEAKILTEQEKNAISAKIIKAELMGKLELANKLKQKLEASRALEKQPQRMTKDAEEKSDSSAGESDSSDEVVVLTRTSKTGQAWPVTKTSSDTLSKRQKKKKVKVHDTDGERERYFADDDRYSLRDLVERERSGAAEDQTQVLNRLSSKMFRGTDGENFTLDDMFVSQAGTSNTTAQEEARHEQRAIQNHQKLMRRLEKCKYCFGNSQNPKHLLVTIGRVAYLRLPSHRPLQTGHCVIAPMHHCSTGTALDEDVWSEIRKFMQCLCKMFSAEGDDCVFLQTCINLKRSPHFFIECIPLAKELGDLAPIYFKKAIQECEGEWAQNKKLVDTRGSNVRSKLPAGLPYFAVDFGLDGGFAHVVEDESSFPLYFGREVLGGMLDAEPSLWRKPHEEHFNEQMKRAVDFEKNFKPFDWTRTELS